MRDRPKTTAVSPRTLPRLVAAVLLIALPMSAAAQEPAAQDPGYTRIQGQDFQAPAAPSIAPLGPVLDFREEMRQLVQRIAEYARGLNPRFAVIARDADDLIIKRDIQDERVISPARTFMRSVDAVMFDALFAGHRTFGAAPPDEVQAVKFERVERARRAGLPVLSLEFAAEPAEIARIYRAASARGVVAAVKPRPTAELTALPPYPRRPFNENPKNVLAMGDVRNYVYIADPAAFGRQDQFALDLKNTNFDMVVVDPFAGRTALGRRAVETLKYKKLGARRMVVARLDVSTAASYRYYWQDGWREGSPAWIEGPYPGNPDRYFVEYWSPAWQDLLYGNDQSFLFGIVGQGYDGVILEGLRSYLAFEGNVEVSQEFAPMALEQAQ